MTQQPSRQEAVKAVGAYIIATCERRLELKGRKWDEVRNLSHGIAPTPVSQKTKPIQLAEGGQHISLPCSDPIDGWSLMHGDDDTLADILRHCCLPLRFEPANGTLFHRGIASPGANYPIDVRLHVPTMGEEKYWLRLDPTAACLFRTIPVTVKENRDDEIRILLNGDLNKLLDPYGDMSANLVTLEAGMAAHQIALFAQSTGMDARTHLIGNARQMRDELGTTNTDLWPLVEIRLSHPTEKIAQGLCHGTFRPTRRANAELSVADFPFLEDYRRACESYDAQSEDIELGRTDETSSPSYSSEELRHLCLNRTSGALSGDGRLDETWSQTEIEQLRDELAKSESAGPSNDMGRFATVHFSFRVAVGEVYSFAWQPVTGAFSKRPTLHFELDAMTNMHASLVATFGVDDASLLSRLGPRGHLAANAMVGMLIQRVTLAVTSVGRDARAIGAFNGIEANQLLSFDQRAYLQLKANRSIRPNPFFRIDWIDET